MRGYLHLNIDLIHILGLRIEKISQHYSLSYRELDERVNTSLTSVG